MQPSYCSNCGATLAPNVRFCSSCGAPLPAVQFVSTSVPKIDDMRKEYAVTFVFALATAIFWFLQRYSLDYSTSVFDELSFILSLAARVTVVISFVRRKVTWLAISAYASITSLLLSVVSALLFGTYFSPGPATLATWMASIGTVASFYVQSRKLDRDPFRADFKDL